MLTRLVSEAWRQFRQDRIRSLRGRRPVLRSVNIETAYACNMNCRSCSRGKNRRAPFMAPALFAKIISELKDAGFRGPLGLHYAGEPLLHPDFGVMAETVARAGLARAVFLYTNGLLLDRAHAAIMRGAGIRTLNVSLDGDKAYVSAYRAPDAYDRILENLRLIRRDFAGAFDVTVHATLFEQSPASLEQMMRDVRPYVDRIRITPSLDQDTMRFNPHALFKEPRCELAGRACPVLWESMTVLSDGRLNACCFELGASLLIPGADLNEQSVTAAFRSEPYEALRARFLERRFQPPFRCCAVCSAWRMGTYEPTRFRIQKLTPRHIVTTNGYIVKHWFRG